MLSLQHAACRIKQVPSMSVGEEELDGITAQIDVLWWSWCPLLAQWSAQVNILPVYGDCGTHRRRRSTMAL